MRGRTGAQSALSFPWALVAVFSTLLFVGYVRLRVADVPLERDEGEYAYAGQLILQGVPPYELAYNMKFPGTYYAYAMILAVFGHTPWGIHVGLLLVNAVTILLVFVLGRRLLGSFAGVVSAVSFSILSLDRWVYGVFAHATHFVVLFAIAGLLLLLRAIENERRPWFFWSGVLLGVSVLMKQHAVFFLPLAAVLLVWSGSPGAGRFTAATAKKLGVMALGAALPFVLVVAVLLAQGVLGRFWFWTFHYARAYVSEVSIVNALPNLFQGLKAVTPATLVFWVMGGLGLVALWIARWEPRAKLCLTGMLVASFLAICPGFYFRPHYFILALPVVALLSGVAVSSLRDILLGFTSRGVAVALSVAVVVVAVGLYATKERSFLFSIEPRELSRLVYGRSPFIEAVEIARYVREHTDANDRIAVLGSEPEIYFYASRRGATGYIYTYPMMEPQPYAKTMQQEMIREIEASHPRYLIFSWIDLSWLARKESDQGLIEWGRRYVRQCYDPVGVADIVSETETRYVWGADSVRSYVASSSNLVYTFRRKSDARCAASEEAPR